MKKSIKLISTIALTSTAISFAEPIQDVGYENYMATSGTSDIPTIQTSKTHHMSRLLNMQTSQVLESYGLAFSGSGNIHAIMKNFDTDGIEGSLVLGLGNVVDIGYELSEFYNTSDETTNRSEGFIKMQAVEQGKFMPSFALAYSQVLQSNFGGVTQTQFNMDIAKYMALASKNFSIGAYNFGVHFTMEGIQYDLKSIESREYKEGQQFKMQPQLGLTWQKSDGTQFILENRMLHLLESDWLSSNVLDFDSGIESNFAVRFHIQTWLMFDTGVRNLYNFDDKTNRTQIHANISGVIPLGSLGNRISSYF